jgi:hypothetical protein
MRASFQPCVHEGELLCRWSEWNVARWPDALPFDAGDVRLFHTSAASSPCGWGGGAWNLTQFATGQPARPRRCPFRLRPR